MYGSNTVQYTVDYAESIGERTPYTDIEGIPLWKTGSAVFVWHWRRRLAYRYGGYTVIQYTVDYEESIGGQTPHIDMEGIL